MARKKIADSREVLVDDARLLVTLDVPSPRRFPLHVKSAIIRLRPSAEATDEQVEGVREKAIKAGAEKVFALPRPRARVIPEAVAEARHKFRSMGPRKVVEQLVEESNSGDKDQLRDVVGKVLAEAGL